MYPSAIHTIDIKPRPRGTTSMCVPMFDDVQLRIHAQLAGTGTVIYRRGQKWITVLSSGVQIHQLSFNWALKFTGLVTVKLFSSEIAAVTIEGQPIVLPFDTCSGNESKSPPTSPSPDWVAAAAGLCAPSPLAENCGIGPNCDCGEPNYKDGYHLKCCATRDEYVRGAWSK